MALITLSPLMQRRLNQFKANRRGYISLWIFLGIFFITLFARFISNDKPFVVYFDNQLYYPIVKVYPEKNRAVVEGVNMRKRHAKGNQPGSGQIQEFAAPIHISNLMVIDPKNGQPTRVGRKEVDGKLVRYSKKTGEIL